MDLFNASGTVNAVIDIEGWFQDTYTSGITGTVSDTQTPAQPVPGVTVTYTGGTAHGTGTTTTDAGGAYTFSSLSPANLYGRRSCDQVHVAAPQTVTVIANTVNRVRQPTATSSISGGVFDTQTPAQPVAGATVTYAPARRHLRRLCRRLRGTQDVRRR